MTNTRYRVQHRFWLDIVKDDQDELDQWIHHLKETRRWTVTVVQHLKLAHDIHVGDMESAKNRLETISPELVEAIREEERQRIKSENQDAIIDAIYAQKEALAQQVEALKAMLSLGVRQSVSTVSQPLPALEAGSIFAEGGDDTVSSGEARTTFAEGFGDLFEDDEDLWDDED